MVTHSTTTCDRCGWQDSADALLWHRLYYTIRADRRDSEASQMRCHYDNGEVWLDLCRKCAAIALTGLKKAKLIETIKQFPGEGMRT